MGYEQDADIETSGISKDIVKDVIYSTSGCSPRITDTYMLKRGVYYLQFKAFPKFPYKYNNFKLSMFNIKGKMLTSSLEDREINKIIEIDKEDNYFFTVDYNGEIDFWKLDLTLKHHFE